MNDAVINEKLIIYCSEKHRKMNEFKPFYLDDFLNPGKCDMHLNTE